jgi:hypothetical protein
MDERSIDRPAKPAGDTKPHRKPGRPTTYDPSYIDVVLDLGRKGYSKAEIAAEITNGSYEQLDRWSRAVPEFREAMLRARELSLAYWEGLARSQVGNRDFNSNLYRIAMQGRFSAEYRESKVVVEHQQPSGLDFSRLSPEELEAFAALLNKIKIPSQPASASQDPPGQPQPAGESPKPARLRDSVH